MVGLPTASKAVCHSFSAVFPAIVNNTIPYLQYSIFCCMDFRNKKAIASRFSRYGKNGVWFTAIFLRVLWDCFFFWGGSGFLLLHVTCVVCQRGRGRRDDTLASPSSVFVLLFLLFLLSYLGPADAWEAPKREKNF